MSEAEQKADAEVEAAIKASIAANPDDVIGGIGYPSSGPLYLKSNPTPKAQYNTTLAEGEKPIILTYFAIPGTGEVPKLLLAEANMPYDCISLVGSESQAVSLNWRSRSPNKLLPILSGGGIPRSAPISQSGSIVRFLAKKLGMDGGSDVLASCQADMLYETTKDLSKGDNMQLLSSVEPDKNYTSFKGPFATGKSIEEMLSNMADPKDPNSVLNYGQLELFETLLKLEARRAGCVKENLGDALDAFRVDMENRAGLKEYLGSTARFPYTKGQLGQDGGYVYWTGPLKRGDVKY